ncbi:MAG: dTDP-4-dehydrorhamnose 3,5-epimerase [Acidobacteria bacterium RIFCSPLOWO2_02_FULL_59_13]|nr:MAG: dTDP-4-dehydrorhamnose 3,5-epimerase [Acidobacteria bacterium RIFCSPLOWO2_02_FULL_59_13]OGA68041.1 MAG: dTDP-4-dehydrorhamnose 3,5-epimerase [Betaproteobacteria bacterium RIFCSPLOWO2_12_FULL_65_14]
MKFKPTLIGGALVVEMERLEDDRGYFARTWCTEEFAAHGLKASMAQCSISFNRVRGTLRGMHYQVSPSLEAKLIRCSRGAIYDVIVDARRGSATEGKFFGLQLTQDDPVMLYAPEGVAHGFITLTDDAEVIYTMSTAYQPDDQAGFRWDDPEVAIEWPIPPSRISSRDANLPLFAARRVP